MSGTPATTISPNTPNSTEASALDEMNNAYNNAYMMEAAITAVTVPGQSAIDAGKSRPQQG